MKMSLRERGVYRLTDGREFVVIAGERGEYILFNPHAWTYGGYAEYTVRSDGKILSKGVPTRWSVEDLTDTGRTLEPR